MTFGRKPPGQGGAPLDGGEAVTVEHTGRADMQDPAFKRHDVVLGVRAERIGIVMDNVGPCYQLRPPAGGPEWEAEPQHIEPAPAEVQMSARVAEANRDSGLRGERW